MLYGEGTLLAVVIGVVRIYLRLVCCLVFRCDCLDSVVDMKRVVQFVSLITEFQMVLYNCFTFNYSTMFLYII